jgi:hypothetical protein
MVFAGAKTFVYSNIVCHSFWAYLVKTSLQFLKFLSDYVVAHLIIQRIMNKSIRWKQLLIQLVVLPIFIIVGTNLLSYLAAWVGIKNIGKLFVYSLTAVSILINFFFYRYFNSHEKVPELKPATVGMQTTSAGSDNEPTSTNNSSNVENTKEDKNKKEEPVPPNPTIVKRKLSSRLIQFFNDIRNWDREQWINLLKIIGYVGAFVGAIFLIKYLFSLIPIKKIGQELLTHNILSSFIFVILLFQFTLRKKTLAKQTWKKVVEIWLKWSGISALTVGGFGFIASNDGINGNLLKITTASPLADIKLMTTIYIVVLLITGIAMLLTAIGRSKADSDETHIPKYLFIPALVLSWVSFNGLNSLMFCSLILTFHAHLTNT